MKKLIFVFFSRLVAYKSFKIINANIFGLFLLLIAFSGNAFPQNNTDADTMHLRTSKRLPILNGFRFIPSDIVKDPFINTYFRINAGAGLALDLQTEIKNFQGTVVDTVTGDLTYILAEIEFQYAVNDWLSLNFMYSGSGRLGSNTYTLLSEGISYTTGYSLGSKVRVINKENYTVSLNANYSSTQIALYSIYDYIKRAVQNYGDTTVKNDLLTKDKVNNLFLSTNAAYAPNNWLGFLGVAGFGFGKPFEQKVRGNFKLGFAASVDFLNLKPIYFPIGILASAKYSAFSEMGENSDNLFTYGLRIGYTGHKDFDIGMEAAYSKLTNKKTNYAIESIQYSAKVRYYF